MGGIAEMLSHECNKMGHSSFVTQLEALDPFKFGEFYQNQLSYKTMDKWMSEMI